MSRRLRVSTVGLLAFGLASSLVHAAASSGSPYALERQFVVGGPGGWDYLIVDPETHNLLISRADRVLVVNVSDGSLVATIPETSGVHGIALAPKLGKGFTSNGRADSVTVFDLRTFKPTATIDVEGHNPDAILYDPASKHLYTFNGRSEDVSVIDPLVGRVIAKLPAGGKPEFAATDGSGHIFFNIEDKSQLGVIDSAKSVRVATWELANCEEPTGLAFDAKHHRLFSVCGNGVLVVTDARTGRHVAEVPIGKGPDAAAFDSQRGLVFSSNGQDGTLTVIREDDPDHFRVLDTVPTAKSARTMALDTTTHRLYLVAAQFGAAPAPTEDQPHPRPPVLDHSFTVLVVGN
jgi:YVTN family beta-propeller protein